MNNLQKHCFKKKKLPEKLSLNFHFNFYIEQEIKHRNSSNVFLFLLNKSMEIFIRLISINYEQLYFFYYYFSIFNKLITSNLYLGSTPRIASGTTFLRYLSKRHRRKFQKLQLRRLCRRFKNMESDK